MIGDVIGKPGRVAVENVLPRLREERHIDLVTANGENLAGGMGLTASTAAALFDRPVAGKTMCPAGLKGTRAAPLGEANLSP